MLIFCYSPDTLCICCCTRSIKHPRHIFSCALFRNQFSTRSNVSRSPASCCVTHATSSANSIIRALLPALQLRHNRCTKGCHADAQVLPFFIYLYALLCVAGSALTSVCPQQPHCKHAANPASGSVDAAGLFGWRFAYVAHLCAAVTLGRGNVRMISLTTSNCKR